MRNIAWEVALSVNEEGAQGGDLACEAEKGRSPPDRENTHADRVVWDLP